MQRAVRDLVELVKTLQELGCELQARRRLLGPRVVQDLLGKLVLQRRQPVEAHVAKELRTVMRVGVEQARWPYRLVLGALWLVAVDVALDESVTM